MLDVLAYCSDVKVWTPGVRYATELAASLGAALTAVHVAPPLPRHEPAGVPPSLMAELVAHAQEEIGTAVHAGARFDAWARSLGVASAKWHVALGDPADVLGIAGNWHDVIVVDRRICDRHDTSDLIRDVLLAGFVCIAVPDGGYSMTRFDRVAIAYDGSLACIRALRAAMPLLQRASHVLLLDVTTANGDSESAVTFAFDPVGHLAERGIAVERSAIEREAVSPARAVLDAVSVNRADMLVSGARGKRRPGDSRLHEIPRYFLDYAGVPLLMAH